MVLADAEALDVRDTEYDKGGTLEDEEENCEV